MSKNCFYCYTYKVKQWFNTISEKINQEFSYTVMITKTKKLAIYQHFSSILPKSSAKWKLVASGHLSQVVILIFQQRQTDLSIDLRWNLSAIEQEASIYCTIFFSFCQQYSSTRYCHIKWSRKRILGLINVLCASKLKFSRKFILTYIHLCTYISF